MIAVNLKNVFCLSSDNHILWNFQVFQSNVFIYYIRLLITQLFISLIFFTCKCYEMSRTQLFRFPFLSELRFTYANQWGYIYWWRKCSWWHFYRLFLNSKLDRSNPWKIKHFDTCKWYKIENRSDCAPNVTEKVTRYMIGETSFAEHLDFMTLEGTGCTTSFESSIQKLANQ